MRPSVSQISPGFKLGILGGGQLARMLSLAAHPYGITPLIYTAASTDPAAQVSSHVFLGNPQESDKLEAFLKNCDVVTFESEFLDSNLLETLSLKTKTPIFPSPQLMGKLQDRLFQKRLLEKYKIPTAPYFEAQDWDSIQKHQSWGSEIVLKQRRFGYDGYGTFFISPKNGLQSWKDIQTKTQEGFIGEQKMNFKRELALLFARDLHGKIIDFPLVETKQTQARCDWVMGPVIHKKLAPLKKAIHKLLKKENYIGLIAFEIFDLGTQLYVNEIAPRVHNSGHYSQEALSLSQFQAHLLAVCSHQLPTVKIISPFAMANLIGSSSEIPQWSKKMWGEQEIGQLHWYGKIDNRKNRKMGHINTLGKTPPEALKSALRARRKVQL